MTYNDGSDKSAAATAAAAADVAIIFLATSSSEGSDRKDLSFGNGQDDLVTEIVKAQPNTVVVGVTPGAVLLPWSLSIKSLLLVGMPGLEYGHSITDILYGDTNPSGRLSLTMPNKENEVGFTPANWPGVDGKSNYTEKLEVGYRYYDAHDIKFTTGFPFGHGLSYTTFEYSKLSVSDQHVSAVITNTGDKSGAEVVQLYLAFPTSAGEPPQQLKGFTKVVIEPGESKDVEFDLTDRDLSTYDVTTHAWQKVTGQFQVMMGASSRDIRLRATTTF